MKKEHIDAVIEELHITSDLNRACYLLLLGMYELLISIAYKLDCVEGDDDDEGGGKNL